MSRTCLRRAVAAHTLLGVSSAVVIAIGVITAAMLAATATSTRAAELAQQFSDPSRAEAYWLLQQAIVAADICENREFSRDEQYAMAEVIDLEIDHALGAAERLYLIERAKNEIDSLVRRSGCSHRFVESALRTFREILWPALLAAGHSDPAVPVVPVARVSVGQAADWR